MLHSLNTLFDEIYSTNVWLQTKMINVANRDDNHFYRLALYVYSQLQKQEKFDVAAAFNDDEFEMDPEDLLEFEEENEVRKQFVH